MELPELADYVMTLSTIVSLQQHSIEALQRSSLVQLDAVERLLMERPKV